MSNPTKKWQIEATTNDITRSIFTNYELNNPKTLINQNICWEYSEKPGSIRYFGRIREVDNGYFVVSCSDQDRRVLITNYTIRKVTVVTMTPQNDGRWSTSGILSVGGGGSGSSGSGGVSTGSSGKAKDFDFVPLDEAPIKGSSLRDEIWREYDFGGRVYRIVRPKLLFVRPGGTTHRVLDYQDVVHCVPAPGQGGCVLRWLPRDNQNPVQF